MWHTSYTCALWARNKLTVKQDSSSGKTPSGPDKMSLVGRMWPRDHTLKAHVQIMMKETKQSILILVDCWIRVTLIIFLSLQS